MRVIIVIEHPVDSRRIRQLAVKHMVFRVYGILLHAKPLNCVNNITTLNQLLN